MGRRRMSHPAESRRTAWERLAQAPWQALIVGGGIVGASVARDAALRGLRVALVDQQDFAAGTSSRSSRLLHGGLRYLAQGRVGLVREASHEKRILGRIAPLWRESDATAVRWKIGLPGAQILAMPPLPPGFGGSGGPKRPF